MHATFSVPSPKEELANRVLNTPLWTNAGLMLAYRLWLGPNIKQTLVRRLLFAGSKQETLTHWRLNVGPASDPTINQHCVNVSCGCWVAVFALLAFFSYTAPSVFHVTLTRVLACPYTEYIAHLGNKGPQGLNGSHQQSRDVEPVLL